MKISFFAYLCIKELELTELHNFKIIDGVELLIAHHETLDKKIVLKISIQLLILDILFLCFLLQLGALRLNRL